MKFRFFLKQAHFLLLFFFSVGVFSQQSVVNTTFLAAYNNALKLYNSKAYAAAQKTSWMLLKN